MKSVLLLLLASVLSSGCHWFKPPARDTASMGEGARKVASDPAAEELFAKYDREIATGKCNAEIQHWINGYGAERSWITGPADMDGSRMYLSPTRQVGRWIGVKKYTSGEMQFFVLTKDAQEIFSFSATCARTKDRRTKPYLPYADEPGPEFTDKDLAGLIEHTRSYGIIYVWSPHMGYSYSANVTRQGALHGVEPGQAPASGIENARHAMEKVRDKLGVSMSMTVIADSRASRRNVQSAFDRGNHDLKADHLKKMGSFELMMRSMGQHYPSLLVYGNGKIFRQIKPGVAGFSVYEKFIEDAVTELRK